MDAFRWNCSSLVLLLAIDGNRLSFVYEMGFIKPCIILKKRFDVFDVFVLQCVACLRFVALNGACVQA